MIADLTKLKQSDLEVFIAKCKAEFIPRPLEQVAMIRSKQLMNVSFAPNAVSFVTATVFVYFLIIPFWLPVKIASAIVFGAILIGLEACKRFFFTRLSTDIIVPGRSFNFGTLIVCVLLLAISAGISYSGGEKIPALATPPPAKVINPEIEELDLQIASIDASILKQESTTWQGAITRQANKNIAEWNQQRAVLVARKISLQAQDDFAHEEVLAKFNTGIKNYGYITGGVAAFSDLLIFLILFNYVKFRHQVARTQPNVSPNGRTNGVFEANEPLHDWSNELQDLEQRLLESSTDREDMIKRAKQLKAQNLSYQRIADKLGIAKSTAYTYVNSM